MSTKPKVLVLTIEPYRFSTRAGKAARSYRTLAEVSFVALARAGRTRRWDEPGCFIRDGVQVVQLPIAAPWLSPTRVNQIRNLLWCYIPALLRMIASALRVRADVVHVTGVHLGVVGVLHCLRFRSKFVLDVTERPGMVTSSGSITSIFAKCERPILRALARVAGLVTVATDDDVPVLAGLGFKKVHLLRNAPSQDWRAPFVAPSKLQVDGTLQAVVIGSIFEGRGYEMLLRSLARAKAQARVKIAICGPGRQEYLAELKQMARDLGVSRDVEWVGPIEGGEVSQRYLEAHLGLVLYESSDAGNDGLSNKLMECVSTGRPVIAGDLPQNRRFIERHHVGWVAPLTAEGLASVLVDAAKTDRMEALADTCRGLGDSWLNWEAEFAPVLAHIKPRGPV